MPRTDGLLSAVSVAAGSRRKGAQGITEAATLGAHGRRCPCRQQTPVFRLRPQRPGAACAARTSISTPGGAPGTPAGGSPRPRLWPRGRVETVTNGYMRSRRRGFTERRKKEAETGSAWAGGVWGPGALPVGEPKGDTAVRTECGKGPAALGIDPTPFPSRDQLQSRLSRCPSRWRGWTGRADHLASCWPQSVAGKTASQRSFI